ncbi:hypothetical protein [Rathayibacter sp. SD072]|uniref:hypothetical protein n=1 Tax=Rathayibacter sp. SD072 TaxID=2781731 RepID=UPI001A97B3C0|nr:hypothetical protein [Rathayibacter sp. SD072]MBO0984009.1 hypothetical protein [Rathayibacter sp. SD072]
MDTDSSEHPLAVDDALALVSVLAVLEGALASGGLPSDVESVLIRHLVQNDLLLPGADRGELLDALRGLDERVRAVLG